MRSASAPIPYRHSLLLGAKLRTPFNTAFETSFANADVPQAADMLCKASDTEWIGQGAWDLRAWMGTPPLVADKVRFVHTAIRAMPRHQAAAAEALIGFLEELLAGQADTEHMPAALDYMLHASAHAWWVLLLTKQPELLTRYCALLGKGPDAARAYCFLAKHMASEQDTSPYACEIWHRSLDSLDGATRLHITTHIRAFDRPVFTWEKYPLYRRLAPQVSDQRGFKTLLPMYRFVFRGTPNEQERLCDWVLRAFVHNASRHTGRQVQLEEFDGIRRTRTRDGRPLIEVFYSSFVAQTVRHCMGISPGMPTWPMEPEIQSRIDVVRSEFKRRWLDSTLKKTAPGTDEPIAYARASRRQYAAVIQQLSAHNLLIGESHGHFAGINFLLQNMHWLRQAGFIVLYLENMPAEAQGLANDFLSGKSMAPALALVHRREFLALLKRAKETGMRVVFLDTDMVKASIDVDEHHSERVAAFNAFACELINDDAALRGGGKFVALLGGFHLGEMQQRLPSCKSLFMFDLQMPEGANAAAWFSIVSHNTADYARVDPNHLLSQVTADVYVGANKPAQMSLTDDAPGGIRARGVLPFQMPPDTPGL